MNEGMGRQQLDTMQYKNEFSTGKNVNVSAHPNRFLLPTFQNCGNLNFSSDSSKSNSTTKDQNYKRPTRIKRVVGGIPTTSERYLPWMAQVYIRNGDTHLLNYKHI